MATSLYEDIYKKVLIIIPAYNEESSVGAVIDEVRRSLPHVGIVVVNDGSSDRTGEIAGAKGVFVLSHVTNLGIGATVQTGLKFASRRGYEIAVQVDGDGQHEPEDLQHLIAPLLRGEVDMVIGSRFLGMSSFLSTAPRRVGIFIFSVLIFLLTGKWVTDPTSGFRAMNKKVIELFASQYPNDYPEPEVLMTVIGHKLKFQEIGVSMKPRLGGISSISPFRAVYYMVKVSFAIVMELMRAPQLHRATA